MNAKQKLVKREFTFNRNDNFPIEDESLRLQRSKRRNQLRKIAMQRLAGFGLEMDFIAIAKCDAAEAVPLRLVEPVCSGRDRLDESRFHGSKWRMDGKIHSSDSSLKRPRFSSRG